MAILLTTGPTVEPISLATVKSHLRIDSEDLADDISTEISIASGDHVVAASYTLLGSAVEVSGYGVLVNLISGTNGASGTVDVKLQESADSITWSDVASGSFTQVTEANDNAIQEKAYTGSYRYIRAVATIAVATCDFGVSVIKKIGPSIEDDLLTALIVVARQYCEAFQRRTYITQTWDLWLDDWPVGDTIILPLPPIQSITSIKYYDTDDAVATFSSGSYFLDLKSAPGRVVLNYGAVWPSTTLRPTNAVNVTYVTGYGNNATDVPQKVRQAMLLFIGHLYENREAVMASGMNAVVMPFGIEALLWQERVF